MARDMDPDLESDSERDSELDSELDSEQDAERMPAPNVPATELEMATLVGVDNELAESGFGPGPIRPVAAKTEFRIIARRFFRHKAARAGLIVMALIILLAFSSIGFGPIPGWWKYDYTDFEPTLTNGGAPTLSVFPPAWGDHPFGQSNEGRDYFALTMRGLQQSLIIAFIVGIVSTIIGTIIGAVSGYYRGRVESILMRFTDVMITIPLLAVAAVISSQIGGSGVIGLAVLLGFVTWTSLARIVRGEFLSLREKEFVDAARSVGASSRRIIFRHILPEHHRRHHGVGDAGDLRCDPPRDGPELPQLRREEPGHLAGAAAAAVPAGDGRAAVPVLVARCLHRADLAVRELHR